MGGGGWRWGPGYGFERKVYVIFLASFGNVFKGSFGAILCTTFLIFFGNCFQTARPLGCVPRVAGPGVLKKKS